VNTVSELLVGVHGTVVQNIVWSPVFVPETDAVQVAVTANQLIRAAPVSLHNIYHFAIVDRIV